MAKRLNAIVLGIMVVVVVVANYLLESSEAKSTTTHVVGDTLGWTIPPGGSVAYTTWAATKTFTVGDILVFNYTSGEHDVAEVMETDFGDCNSTNTLSMGLSGPTNVTLDSAGKHFFICTFGTHCNLGQKVAINVSATTSSPPPSVTPIPPPPPPPSPPPPANTAPSFPVSTLPAALLSIIVALLH